VDSLVDALTAVEVLAYLPQPRASGDPHGGLAVLSTSGGAGALLADHSSEYGIPMAEFSPGTAQKLERLLPEFARKANPVDLTGQINAVPTMFRDTCLAIEADPRVEAMIVQFASSGRGELHWGTAGSSDAAGIPRSGRAAGGRSVSCDECAVTALQAPTDAVATEAGGSCAAG
jgi:acyl-CoA synthetase (NDP forming)